MDRLKGWKTLLFQVIMGSVVFAQVYSGQAPDPGPIMETLEGFELATVSLWGFGNMILRAVTNTAIFTKG